MKEVSYSQMSLVQIGTDTEEKKDININKDNGRVFNYTLNERRAKAKLLRGAKNDENLYAEVKPGCVNLRFNGGVYFELVLPLLQIWHKKCNETVQINDTKIKILEVDSGVENTGKTVDTKLAVLANGTRFVLHAYNSTQNLMVQGKNYEDFALNCLQPFFMEKIENAKERIRKVNNDIKKAFGPRSQIEEDSEKTFSCPQCEIKTKTNSNLKVHIKSCHSKPAIYSPNNNKIIKISEETDQLDHDVSGLKMIEMVYEDDTVSGEKEPNLEEVVTEPSVRVDVEEEPAPIYVNTITETEIICCLCKFTCKNIDSLRVHIENVHTTYESEPAPKAADLEQLITSEGTEICIKCPHCDFLDTEESMERHISNEHGYLAICDECGKTFEDTKTCEAHIESEHSIPQGCDECGLLWVNSEDLKEHKNKYHSKNDVTTYHCEKCDLMFDTQIGLKAHISKHHARLNVVCDLCDHQSTMYTDILKHKVAVHDEDKPNTIEPFELFLNVLAAQQDAIFEILRRFDTDSNTVLKDIASKTDGMFKEVNVLRDNIKEVRKDINKIDDKIKTTEHVNNVQPNPNREKKILFVGDSLSRKMNLSVIKNVTNHEVKRVEAFIVDKNDKKAKYPEKNFIDTVSTELESDQFSTLILQGGTNEITNLDVSGYDAIRRIEVLKDEVRESSEKLFKLAENSLAKNASLDKVIIMKRMFRCDTPENDPAQLRFKLSEYGNRVLDDMWLSKGCPKNIIIVRQDLDCYGDLRLQRFGSPSSPGYDGIHMKGDMAVQHYTGSLIQCLVQVMPECYPTGVTSDNNRRKHGPSPHYNQPRYIPRQPAVQPQPQPQHVHRPGRVSYPHQYQHQYQHRAHTSPATGANSTPLGGQWQYNIRTQNRFSQLSGN